MGLTVDIFDPDAGAGSRAFSEESNENIRQRLAL
jgi:hypothetical protein